MEFKKFAVGLHHYGDGEKPQKKQQPYVNFSDEKMYELLNKDVDFCNQEESQ